MPRQPPTAAMRPQRIPANEYQRVRWHNGAGWTREILKSSVRDVAGSDPEAAWDWRLSIAEIEQATDFSRFPGLERELVLLRGNGLRLRFDDGRARVLQPPHGRCQFRGECGLTGEPVDGPAHAFNLMWRREAVYARLWHRPLVGSMLVFVDPGTCWAAYLVAGDARISGDAAVPPLAGGDTAVLTAGDGRARFVIEGGGELLLVRVESSA